MIVQSYILKLCFIKWVLSKGSNYHCERFGKLTFQDGGKGCFRDSWSAICFSVKCEMANFFLVNHDLHSSREVWFCKIIFREIRKKCLFAVISDFHYVFVVFDNHYYVINDKLRDRDRMVDPCYDDVVGLVFGDLWPAIIFILCFIYVDQNGGSTSMQCPKWPRWQYLTFVQRKTFSFFSVKHEMLILFFGNRERTVLFFCETFSRPSFTTLFQAVAICQRLAPHPLLWERASFGNVSFSNLSGW